MVRLAMVYIAQDRYAEAEVMGVQVLELRREVLGERHPDTLYSMQSLALVCNLQGRDNDAISLMDECLQLRREVLGLEHPSTKEAEQLLNDWKIGQDAKRLFITLILS
jgi:hypothetical protein